MYTIHGTTHASLKHTHTRTQSHLFEQTNKICPTPLITAICHIGRNNENCFVSFSPKEIHSEKKHLEGQKRMNEHADLSLAQKEDVEKEAEDARAGEKELLDAWMKGPTYAPVLSIQVQMLSLIYDNVRSPNPNPYICTYRTTRTQRDGNMDNMPVTTGKKKKHPSISHIKLYCRSIFDPSPSLTCLHRIYCFYNCHYRVNSKEAVARQKVCWELTNEIN